MQKMPVDMRLPLGGAIATRAEQSFANDRTLSVMLWLGFEPYLAKNADAALKIARETTFPIIRESIARRFTSEIDDNMPAVEKLLATAADEPKLKADILRGCAAALDGRKGAPTPSNWAELAPKLTKQSAADSVDSLNIIGIAFGDDRTIASLNKQLLSPSGNSDSRKRALKLLLMAHPRGFNSVLMRLLNDPDLATEAIRGLAAYEDRDAPNALLDLYSRLEPEQRAAVINTLASRRIYATALIQALEAKKLRASDISAVQARQLMSLGDSDISDRVRALWGDARSTSGDKQEAMSRMRAVLIPSLSKADLENGKAVYTKTCATCHVLFGQGTKIGPELTGSNRKNLDYLLENVLDPSAVVPAEFRTTVFILSDGRVLNGIVREQSDQTIAIETADGKQTIDKKLIDETSVSDKSLMPDGLLQPLSSTQVRDLMGYLMSD
jgi:putative heme-binding domain-containing protein